MSVSAKYTVTGMTCGHCEASVREELEELQGVERVDVDRENNLVEIHSETALQPDLVTQAIKEAGYESEPVV
ncbi:heavy-metal-associated domain-containing protein [Corynebacterium sp. 335C]